MSELEKGSTQDAVAIVSKNLLAGAMARGLAATIMFPIDVVKTRMQFQRKNLSNNPTTPQIKYYRNGWHAFTSILREEGFIRMYKGLPVRLIYITPSAAVSFTVYEQFMSALKQRDKDGGSWKYLLLTLAAGASARVFGTAARTPLDILKQQLQVEGQIKNAKSQSILGTIKQILSSDGLKGFWSGYGVTLLRDAPFAAIYFTSYEGMKMLNERIATAITSEEKSVKRTKGIQHFVSGAFAGAIATFCTIPIDVVKTRLQTQTKLGTKDYDGIVHAFKKIYREEGAKAFATGLGPRLAYLMPAAALTFTIYEKLKDVVQL